MPSDNSGQQTATTLKEMNMALGRAGLPLLNPAIAAQMQELAPKGDIINAVLQCPNDVNAKEYVTQLFDQLQAATPRSATPAPVSGAEKAGGDEACRPDDSSFAGPAKYHVYGDYSALCFEVDKTRLGFPTISIDAANASEANNYDWGNKTRIQLTKEELPEVMAVFLAVRMEYVCNNHGTARNKSISFERQKGRKIYVKVTEGNKRLKAVPVKHEAVFHILAIFMKQCLEAYPWLSGQDICRMIGATVGSE